MDEARPMKRRSWYALWMHNGCFHVRVYHGTYDYQRSEEYERFGQSKSVRRWIGPVTSNLNVSARPILERKAERYGFTRTV